MNKWWWATLLVGCNSAKAPPPYVDEWTTHMYEGTTQREIRKNLENKDVTGPYGQAFHVIGDLVIESIDLCDDRWLDISIGS